MEFTIILFILLLQLHSNSTCSINLINTSIIILFRLISLSLLVMNLLEVHNLLINIICSIEIDSINWHRLLG